MEKKLPILATMIAAFDLCRNQGHYAFKIIAPWFVVLLATPYLATALLGGEQNAPDAAPIPLWDLIVVGPVVIGWSMIAVLWHWRILHEASTVQQVMTFDERLWYYILRGFVIVAIAFGIAMLVMIPVLVLMAVFTKDPTSSNGFMLSLVGVLIILGFIVARLSIALPATALGVREFGLWRAWHATANNGFRLFIVTALPMLPLLAIFWIVDIIGFDGMKLYELSPAAIVAHAVVQSLDFAFGLLGLAVLSLAYAFFAQNKKASDLQRPS